jgi:hypothetical protein
MKRKYALWDSPTNPKENNAGRNERKASDCSKNERNMKQR